MKLLDALRRRRADSEESARAQGSRRLPDPAKVPAARGSWEEAALTNVDITEVVKRQIGTITPPWKK